VVAGVLTTSIDQSRSTERESSGLGHPWSCQPGTCGEVAIAPFAQESNFIPETLGDTAQLFCFGGYATD